MDNEKIILVRDVMKTSIDAVDGMTTIQDALHMMKHKETKTLLVKKRYEGDEWGVVMISDIARKVMAKDRSPDRVNVYEIMTKPVLTVSPDMDIRYCARMFERFHLSRAPVADCGNIIGIISFSDMVLKGLCDL